MNIFSGLSAFPITPMTPEGQVIASDLARLVRRIEEGGADSVGLLGSTGTYMFLSREERRRAVVAAVGSVSSIPVIVGVGAMRTDEAQALARDAAESGAAGLLLAPVSYTPLTEQEVYRHFEAVAAIKLPLPAGDLPADLAAFRTAAPGLSVGYSGDWGCKEALLAGADCWFSVVGGLLPEAAAALTRAAMAGDRIAADQRDAAFAGLWALFREHGSLRLVHEAARLMGLTDAGLPPPLLGIDDDLRRELTSVLPRPKGPLSASSVRTISAQTGPGFHDPARTGA